MADLKTNYVDDVLDTTKNQLRKYQQIQNDDGTVSFVDVTEYTQVGTSFGAKDINDTNAAINDVNGKLLKVAFVSREVTVGTNNKATYGGYYAQGLTPKLDETGLNGTLLNIIVAYYGDKSDYHVNCNVKYFKGNPYFSVSSVLESRTILVVFALLYY